MSTQRSPVRSTESGRRRTRRSFLAASAAAGGLLAGCVGQGALAEVADGGRNEAVSVLAAGSLQHALAGGLADAVDVPVEVEAHGSATVARLVAGGQRDPDVVSLADVALFDGPLHPQWSVRYASNAVVLAYDDATEGGRRVERAGSDGWYEALLSDDVSLGRTDPDQDPLGYRTLFTLELASRYYDVDRLHERIPERDQVYPETALLGQFETGGLDAAFTYRNMAESRDYDYVELPDEIDLSDPNHAADWYRTVSYTLASGKTVTGDVVEYAATARSRRDAVEDVLATHVTGEYLERFGFVVPDGFPCAIGEAPERIERRLGSDG